MSIVFVFLVVLMVTMSLLDRRSTHQPRVIQIDPFMFRVNPAFVAGSVLIIGILTALYTAFW